ncbi:MAG TPA: acetyltransferase [Bryobacteraceae bacterium]|nr:acetyltransferase [Bryobacteraceae bacterium]
MTKEHKLILIGDSAFAEVAYEYFTWDSQYEVVAFAVEREYRTRDQFQGLPVVDFEELPKLYASARHHFFASLAYRSRNRLRTRLYRTAKALGYTPASYISSRAFVWRDVELGEHCFIYENNVLQPRVKVGSNVVICSGNHVGHHSRIGSNCYLASHVAISGYVEVGESCFLGVNSTISNNLTVGSDCTIGAGALVLSDVPPRQVVVGTWKVPRVAPAAELTALAVPAEA